MSEHPVLLVDYGEVISLPQPADTVAEMAALSGLEVAEFVERYWRYRPDYDRGGEARGFWTALTGDDALDAVTLERLIRLDVDGWQLLDSEALELLEHARGEGYALSVLSNAPHELAHALRDHPSLGLFDHLIFSAQLGVVKPERAAFEAAVRMLGRRPHEILFIDDRRANVQGATEAGLRALQFTSVPALRVALFG